MRTYSLGDLERFVDSGKRAGELAGGSIEELWISPSLADDVGVKEGDMVSGLIVNLDQSMPYGEVVLTASQQHTEG